jgi:hypothetical protein
MIVPLAIMRLDHAPLSTRTRNHSQEAFLEAERPDELAGHRWRMNRMPRQRWRRPGAARLASDLRRRRRGSLAEPSMIIVLRGRAPACTSSGHEREAGQGLRACGQVRLRARPSSRSRRRRRVCSPLRPSGAAGAIHAASRWHGSCRTSSRSVSEPHAEARGARCLCRRVMEGQADGLGGEP